MSKDKDISQKDAVIPSVAPSESASVSQVMSSEDALVADLVKEQPTLEYVDNIRVTPRQKMPDLLAFPEEVLPLHGKKYRFGWLSKGKSLQISIRTSGWVLCNRVSSPFIKSHRFGSHGAVEQAGMLLAFMPEEQYVELFETGPGRISADRVKYQTKGIFENQDKDAPMRYYKPELSDEDKD